MTAEGIIAALGLARHPEGGWYRQTWAEDTPAGQRPTGTAILFLLPGDEISRWHRVDATEIWHYHAGAPINLTMAPQDSGPAVDHALGPDLLAGEMPQLIVPAGYWQTARSTGAWTLVSCTVSPGFRFDGFEMAPPGFDIPR